MHLFVHTWCLLSLKEVLDAVELKLQMIVSCFVGTGDFLWVLYNGSKCSQLVNHLSRNPRPNIYLFYVCVSSAMPHMWRSNGMQDLFFLYHVGSRDCTHSGHHVREQAALLTNPSHHLFLKEDVSLSQLDQLIRTASPRNLPFFPFPAGGLQMCTTIPG